MRQKISSGNQAFDQAFGGYAAQNLTLFAQRPTMGANLFMINSAIALAETGEQVLFISRSITPNEFIRRATAHITQIPLKEIMAFPALPRTRFTEIKQQVMDVMYHMKEQLDFAQIETFEHMINRIQVSHATKNTTCVFIDTSGEAFTPSELTLLQEMATTWQLTFIVNTSLPRSIETRTDKRPARSDIDIVNKLERVVDMYGFYRECVYYPDNEDKVEILSFQEEGTRKVACHYALETQTIS